MKSLVNRPPRSLVAWVFVITAAILGIYFGRLNSLAVQQTNIPQGDQPALTLRIAVPEGELALQGSDMIPYHEGIPPHLHVVIENVSSSRQSIYDEWNSWGYETLKFEYQMPGDKIRTMAKFGGEWNRNFPSWTTLQPGQVLVRDVYLDRKIWNNIPNLNSVNEHTSVPILFRAIFAQDDKDPHVWQGSIQSPFIQINLVQRR